MRSWTKFRKNGAGSTGRCNTGLEFTRRGFKAQGLSRALLEAQSYLVEIGLRVDGQVGFLREVLSQQAGGIFIGAALPGALRITEVDFHIRVHREALVFGHLVPRSQVNERRRVAGSLSTCLL